jgi:glycosyltransferase involved in cell wall biosynthesis
MKIVHLIPRFPYFGDDTVVGGAASALFNLAREQLHAHTITIIADTPGRNVISSSDSVELDLMPLNIYSPASSLRFGLEYTGRVLWESFKRRGACDILHGHSGYLDYVIATAAFAKRKRVAAVHTLYCPVLRRSNTSLFSRRGSFWRFVAAQIDLFIAISENVARSLRFAGVPAERIRVIPPAVNVHRFCLSFCKRGLRSRLGISNDTPVVLFVGNTKPVKNLEIVLDAMSVVLQRIPKALLIVTTELKHSGHREREVVLSQQIEELGLGQHTIRLGIVDNMPQLMAASDVLVAPFLDTNGPSDYFLAALEAMAVGRPVVVSAVGGMPEIVDTEVGYLVSPRDAEGIANALVALLQDPDRRAAMGCAATSRVRQLFHPKLVASQIQAAYDEVLQG